MRPLIVLGSGGFAFTMLDAFLDFEQGEFELAGFAQNADPSRRGDTLEGYPVYTLEELKPLASTHEAICLIGDCGAKRAFVEAVEPMGFKFATVRLPNSRFSRFSEMGPGGFLGFVSVVAAQCRMEAHCSIMGQCLIGEGCRFGKHVFVASGVQVGGGVTIGPGTYVGIGAVLRDHITLGANVVVGAGAVVVRDVPDGATVVGNPAKPIESRGLFRNRKPEP